MKKLLHVLTAALLLPGIFLSAGKVPVNAASDPVQVTLNESVIKDKIEGGWVGQMAGVSWAAATEFRYNGVMVPDSKVPVWKNSMINDSFWQDDLYAEIPFIDAMKENGPDCSVQILGDYFKNTKFDLFHANLAGRDNLRNGIAAPDSGSYLYNQHCDDIDWMIEADFVGLMNPGLVNASIQSAFRAGHVMCYGDGVYGGVFVSAMHAKAFTAANLSEIIEAGRKSVPTGSKFRQLIEDVLTWKNSGKTWQETWQLLEDKWAGDDRCPEFSTAGNAMDAKLNIDSKLNAGYVLMGLLYGNGDFEQSIKISMQCGQDSDCNPSTVGAILGNYLGLSNIPDKWKTSLNRTGDKFSYTNYSFNDAVNINLDLAKQVVTANGGTVANNVWTIVSPAEIVPATLEQWPDQPTVALSSVIKNKSVTFKAKASDPAGIKSYAWDFGDGKTGTGNLITHQYEKSGNYTVKCTVTNNSNAARIETIRIILGNNIASEGTPVVSVTQPIGSGNKDINVIRDGVMPDSTNTDTSLIYDTYTNNYNPEDAFVGYTFVQEKTVNMLVFQAGPTYWDGGWFANGVKVQVRKNGSWVNVDATAAPAYPAADSQDVFSKQYETYIFSFDPVTCDGIRLFGAAGGQTHFITVAELQVYEYVEEAASESESDNNSSITGSAPVNSNAVTPNPGTGDPLRLFLVAAAVIACLGLGLFIIIRQQNKNVAVK